MARGADARAQELVDTIISDDLQPRIVSTQAKNQNTLSVHSIVITVEKTFSSIELGVAPPLESTLKATHETSRTDCPTYRFK